MSSRQEKGPGHKKRKILERRAETRKVARGEGLLTFGERNWPAIRAALIFAGCLLLALFAYIRLIASDLFQPMLAFTARSTGFLVNAFGGTVEVRGLTLASRDFSMDIVGECTGFLPIILFLCAVVSYPCTTRAKMVGGALGIAILFVLNLVRTTSLFYIGSAFPRFLDVAHYLVWQSLMVLAAIFLWLSWLGRITRVR